MSEKMELKCAFVIIIAGTNQGKSYYSKQLILNEDIPTLVFDVQNCYGPTSTKEGDIIMNLPEYDGTNQIRCRYHGQSERFIQIALLRKFSVIVFEESTIFFEGRMAKDMKHLIVNKWHDQNTIICQFHSIADVPPAFMRKADYIVLFKTGDEFSHVKKKYASLLPHFQKLKGTPDRTQIIIKNY